MSSLSKLRVSLMIVTVYYRFILCSGIVFIAFFFYEQLLENNVKINTAFKNNDVYLHLETSKY